ncbi:ADL042Wp [Eremothecium gossypii ATCC 10895]|uniref:ADL042Wp n=1 Tax=Eremothecium gossypii (strain ATCC 10895 / CBS 109.51 / FGSC 9923 / NRRL Y-1056) TaxID=284811 RepID=Q75AG0_EREGS|nr:ADL042Wp [Eremothecium gossypii ATCC 10895]AAS51878.1 ADL042Wp [Eremothecium gossypii ATCC 10895]AEY96176.1 FADL042Wp [Eremothecium gossypii FDAG1]
MSQNYRMHPDSCHNYCAATAMSADVHVRNSHQLQPSDLAVAASHPISGGGSYHYYPSDISSGTKNSSSSITSRSLPSLPSLKEILNSTPAVPVAPPVPRHYIAPGVSTCQSKVMLPPIQVAHYLPQQRQYEHMYAQDKSGHSSVLDSPRMTPLIMLNVSSPPANPISGVSATSTQQIHQAQILPRRNSLPCFTASQTPPQQPLLNSPLHTRKNPYRGSAYKKNGSVCEICGKDFKRPSALRTHMVVHNNDKPYNCEHRGCQKRFNVKSNMLRHMRKHKEAP